MTYALRLAAVLALLLLPMASAWAEKRVALVIGNNEYPALGPAEQLQKAVNDANAVGDALETLGFDVTRGENLSRGEMLATIIGTASQLQPGDLAFVFYAGHGVSIDGANYLLPSDIPDAESGGESLVKFSSISESMVIETLKARGVRVAMVVLDACRNNPFSRDGTRAFGDGTRGLSRPPAVEKRGVFGLYSAGFGERALDRLGDNDPHPNSVFTRILVPALTEPGHSLLDIAYEVNEGVAELAGTIGHQQNPAYYDQARARDLVLLEAPKETEPAPSPAPVVQQQPADRIRPGDEAADSCAAAQLHFEAARDLQRVEALEDHIQRFAGCQFSAIAAMLIENLENQSTDLRIDNSTPSDPTDNDSDLLAECRRLAAAPVTNTEINAAIKACHAANDRVPTDSVIMHLLGSSYEAAGELAQAIEWYRKAADLGVAEAQLRLGYKYDVGDGISVDDVEAVRLYRKAAEQGLHDAQYNLALMYSEGEGLAEDDAEAMQWFRKAAEQGHAKSQNRLGLHYDLGEGISVDDVEAVQWYRKAAEQGLHDAQYNLGLMYSEGEGLAKDNAEAIQWFRKAAEQGHAKAQNQLGLHYDLGEGISVDDVEAVKWYRQAADQGLDDAQFNLALMYSEGEGLTEDDAEAVRWLRKAAEQGHARAQHRLGVHYDLGEGISVDDVEAVKWYRKAADQGLATAQLYLALMYDAGEGVAQDQEEAVRWLHKAAEQGNADAQNRLALKYDSGSGVALDDEEAVRWFRKSADQGLAAAQYNLGLMYDYGEGVPRNANEAVRWFRLAADQNHGDAIWAMGEKYLTGGGGLPADEGQAAEYFLNALANGGHRAKQALVENRGRDIARSARREIQRALKARGAYFGAIDGVFGSGTIGALETYASGG